MNNHLLISDYYKAHRGELLAFVSSRLQGSSAAEDIVQNVFLRLLTTDKMISEVTMPALVYYRRRSCHEELEHYIKRGEKVEVRSERLEVRSVESVYSAREIMERIERGLARLPENCREVYRLHIYDGMKVSEISQQLDQGYKSVEHRLGLARKTIRQYLLKYA